MIYLFGASGHAKVIIEILEQQQLVVAGLLDANENIKSLLGYPVHGPDSNLLTDAAKIIISIGNNKIRKRLAESMQANFIKAIHPATTVSTRSTIGEGTAIMAGVVVNSDAVIGKHAILNTNCCIDHDCVLSDYVHVSPNAALAGNVVVGEGTHVGIGACIVQGITIGKWATIGAGAVVIADVPDYAVVVGNPARIIKYNQTV